MVRNKTITSDPIFGHIFSKKENCLYLLQQVLPDLNITDVTVTPQKQANRRLLERNVRFDIWAETQDGRKIDIEMQTTKDFMPGTRFRYYQSEMDKGTLLPGAKIYDIRECYIIFFYPFDPVGTGKFIYEGCSLRDKTDLSSVMQTKTHWISVNSKGYKGKITPGLKDFLDYINGEINHDNEFITKIDNEIKEYVANPEWRKIDMNIDLMLADNTHEVQRESIKNAVEMLHEAGVTDKKKIFDLVFEQYQQTFEPDEIKELMQEVEDEERK